MESIQSIQGIPYIREGVIINDIRRVDPQIVAMFMQGIPDQILENGSYKHEIIFSSDLPKRIKLVDTGDHNPYHLFFYMLVKFYYFDNGYSTIKYYYPETKKYICNQALDNLPSRFVRVFKREQEVEYIQCPGCDYKNDWIDETWVYKYVRDLYKHIWESTPQEKGKRVYISRDTKNVRTKAVLNEDVLKPVLKGLGFSSYALEDITFIDTIRLFKSAEFITGVHGAGFAWLVFCDPGTKVLEIFNDSVSRIHYIDLSKKCGLHIERFTDIDMTVEKENITVRIDSFVNHIKKMCV